MHNLPRVSDHLIEALQQGPKSLPFGTLVCLAVTTGLFSTAHRSVSSASAKGLEVAHRTCTEPLHRRDSSERIGPQQHSVGYPSRSADPPPDTPVTATPCAAQQIGDSPSQNLSATHRRGRPFARNLRSRSNGQVLITWSAATLACTTSKHLPSQSSSQIQNRLTVWLLASRRKTLFLGPSTTYKRDLRLRTSRASRLQMTTIAGRFVIEVDDDPGCSR